MSSALVVGGTYFSAIAVSLGLGYFTGSRRSISHPGSQPKSDVIEQSESDTESEEDVDVSKLTIQDDCKLVLVVRTDLGMSTGKIAAQCSHATLACYKTLLSQNSALLKRWAQTGYQKTVVRCSDEDELVLLQAQARSLQLCARSIQDAGRTEIAAGSTTVLGIAGPRMLVEQVTGQLLGL
ncbi:PTH2-domain-containing protein [Mycena belliarum]|uniref:peptidyl-tRNA hydrolase n=1 Tax=Mycena belliarum TaxID=1033014 RepID=A0AAD6UKH6_9AGAR|nr:PTH2-domain-containing protein [Mycena belliae]